MFVLSEILWIIKCTFYLGDKCKKIRCQCANLITGALSSMWAATPPSSCPYLFLADLITLKWIRVHFIKSRKLISSDIDFYGRAIKDYFTGCSRFSSASSSHSVEPPPYRLTCDWHISFRDLLIETSVFNQQGVRATEWRGQIRVRFPKGQSNENLVVR